ncbi:hypothetical protein SEA_SHAGRAT_86 [Rhodococcus phage Shagrat]|nr:hypothetical protein SEA_SHAGRAT_86 [Rhodococcus phage Shagrat]
MRRRPPNYRRDRGHSLEPPTPEPWMRMLFGATPSQAAECLGRIMWEKQRWDTSLTQ